MNMDMNLNFKRKWKFQLEHWLNDLVVFNTTFNNISVISWRSVLLVEVPGTIDLSQVADKLYHIMLNTSPWSRFELTTSVVIGTDCICSCKSNYHTTTACDVAYKGRWLTQAGCWFILRFCEHFTCLSS